MNHSEAGKLGGRPRSLSLAEIRASYPQKRKELPPKLPHSLSGMLRLYAEMEYGEELRKPKKEDRRLFNFPASAR